MDKRSGSLPRITFLGYHSCIRSFKQALALKELGYQVNWVCHIPPPQISFHALDSVLVFALGNYHPECGPDPKTHFDHFKRTVAFVDEKTDIYHAYNEPDWFVHMAKQVTNKPVVWDLHDLVSDRDFIERDEEKLEFKHCDAIITHGTGYKELCSQKRPDLAKAGLIDICMSSVPRILWPDLDMPMVMHGGKKLGGIVYEGGIAEGKTGAAEFRYRWWLPLMEKLVAKNLAVHVYPASHGTYQMYTNVGIRVNQMLNYHTLMQHLTMYDWGLVGNAVHHPAFDKAWPNKVFEYIAAGIPVLVHDSKEVGEFVEAQGIGKIIKNESDAVAVYKSAGDFRAKVLEARQKFAMENEIKKVISIYNKLV